MKDQRSVMETQFSGMTAEKFSYDDYEKTRELLLKVIHQRLNEIDKLFLLGVLQLEPDWTVYDFREYPGIKWKLQNLAKLKQENPDKYQSMINQLQEVLYKH
jgi:hypothetical protein